MVGVTYDSSSFASDWLKGESHAGEYHSRDQITLAAGQGVLLTGSVLAQVTATGQYVLAVAPGPTDGSAVATAILFDRRVDTTGGPVSAVAVTRQATVEHQALVWHPTLNTAALRSAAAVQLGLKGITDRQGA